MHVAEDPFSIFKSFGKIAIQYPELKNGHTRK